MKIDPITQLTPDGDGIIRCPSCGEENITDIAGHAKICKDLIRDCSG